jgi:flagellar motility protein MotE (MotC chaperone)
MRLRLFPVLIATALIALTVRVGDLWTGLGTIARAQSTPQAGSAAKSGRAATGAVSTAAAASEDPTPPEVEAARIMALPSDPFSLSDEEINLLQSLAERRKELDLRAQQLEQREALLLAVELRIDEKIEGLKVLQKSIQGEAESQYKSLVKIYENMKPKDAARIFEELDMAILLPVTERMKERKLAPILAKMNTTKAMTLTTQLAQRRDAQRGQRATGPDLLPIE